MTTRSLSCAGLLLATALAMPVANAQGVPPGPPPAMPTMADTKYDAALVVRDGSATASDGLVLNSPKDQYNGVMVSGGRSAFTLKNAQIALTGMGKNDFLGIGAGALVRDDATLVVDHVRIETSGATSSALVAAENATLRVYDSMLIANGGALPVGYIRHIGPGMMEPPAPLGLDGNARTVLAMSNSRSFFYRTTIEADGWGALSTDATGGNLYLEANDCVLRVKRKGYGTYADFGAHVVLNRTVVESGGELGIIAGKARIDVNGVTGKVGRNGVMIHSVMAFDPTETAELNLKDTTLVSAGPAILVKSANAAITIEGGAITSTSGQLLSVIRNEDPNATKTGGKPVPGVALTLRKAILKGDVANTDTDRALALKLEGAQLAGALHNVVLTADAGSRWTATAASEVVLTAASVPAIDAPKGVTVRAVTADGSLKPQHIQLKSGGELIVSAR